MKFVSVSYDKYLYSQYELPDKTTVYIYIKYDDDIYSFSMQICNVLRGNVSGKIVFHTIEINNFWILCFLCNYFTLNRLFIIRKLILCPFWIKGEALINAQKTSIRSCLRVCRWLLEVTRKSLRFFCATHTVSSKRW